MKGAGSRPLPFLRFPSQSSIRFHKRSSLYPFLLFSTSRVLQCGIGISRGTEYVRRQTGTLYVRGKYLSYNKEDRYLNKKRSEYETGFE